jgi:uncharacterized damage-inducible protein DinB
MNSVDQLRRLFAHNAWNDSRFGEALAGIDASPDVVHEFAHLISTESLWLGRITGELAQHPVFPTWSVPEARVHAERVAAGWHLMISALDDRALDRQITYVNSSGQTFTSALGDILLHVALHGQYHRGRVNVLLRQSGVDPVSTDYIFWVRGVNS